jgi:hypothetical protein
MSEKDRVKMQVDYELDEQPIEDTLGPGAGQLEKELASLQAELEHTTDSRVRQALERSCQDLRARIRTERIHVRRDLVVEQLRERRRRRGDGTPAEVLDRLLRDHPIDFHMTDEYLGRADVQREYELRRRGIRPGGGRMI